MGNNLPSIQSVVGRNCKLRPQHTRAAKARCYLAFRGFIRLRPTRACYFFLASGCRRIQLKEGVTEFIADEMAPADAEWLLLVQFSPKVGATGLRVGPSVLNLVSCWVGLGTPEVPGLYFRTVERQIRCGVQSQWTRGILCLIGRYFLRLLSAESDVSPCAPEKPECRQVERTASSG